MMSLKVQGESVKKAKKNLRAHLIYGPFCECILQIMYREIYNVQQAHGSICNKSYNLSVKIEKIRP